MGPMSGLFSSYLFRGGCGGATLLPHVSRPYNIYLVKCFLLHFFLLFTETSQISMKNNLIIKFKVINQMIWIWHMHASTK